MEWFRALLEMNRNRPTVVFTHAPVMGCGLRVLQEVHVKNRCAWLNHSHNPHQARHRRRTPEFVDTPVLADGSLCLEHSENEACLLS